MTGGKDKKKTNKMIDENRHLAQIQGANFQKDLATRIQGNDAQSIQSRNNLQNSLGGISGRNYDVTGDFGEAQGLYRGFSNNGGIDENRMRGAHPVFQDIANNQDIQNRFRAGGTYEEFNKTGGVSAAEAANLRSRGTSVIPAYYARMKAEADRAGSLQGGYGPGAGALKSRLARDSASASQSAALDTELGISDRVREGRMFGAQGMSQAEAALQGTRLGAAGSLDTSEANIQNSLQRGRMFGAQGIHGISSEQAAIATGNANRNLNRDQFGMGMQADLYNSDRGMERDYLGMNLANRGLTNETMNQGVNQRIAANPITTWRDWVQTVGNLYKVGGGGGK